MFAFITFKVTLGQDLEQWEGKARLCNSLIQGPACGRLILSLPLGIAVNCSHPPWCPWKDTLTARQPSALHESLEAWMPAPLSAPLASHSYIWVSARGLEFTPRSCTLLPLCLMSVASPGPLESPDISCLALSRCLGCFFAWFYVVHFAVSVGLGRDMLGAMSETGGQQRQNQLMDWCITVDYVLSCPLSPCFALLLLQQRAQPVPWVLDQGSCWGPRQAKPPLSSAEGWQKPFCSYCMNNWVGMVNLLNRKLRKGDILAQTGWRWRWQEIQLSKSLYFVHDSSQDFTPFSECC